MTPGRVHQMSSRYPSKELSACAATANIAVNHSVAKTLIDFTIVREMRVASRVHASL